MKNELLASIEIENAICNNTNNSVGKSEISEHVQVTPSHDRQTTKKKQQRFISMSSAEIVKVIPRAGTKNTKDNTKWAIQVFEGKYNAVKIP